MARSAWSKDHSTIFSGVVRCGDVFFTLIAGLGAYVLHLGWWPVPNTYQIAFVLAELLVLLLFPAFGLYRSWRGGGLAAEIRRITVAWISVLIVLIVLSFVTKTSVWYSRGWIGLWAIGGWIALVAFHGGLRLFARWFREKGWNLRRVAIVGAGKLGRGVAAQIQESPWTGYKVVGFYDDTDSLAGSRIGGVRVRGRPESMSKLLSRYMVDEVWLALPLRAEPRVKEILYFLRHSTVTVRFVPDIFGFQLLNHGVTDVAGVPLVDLNATPMVGVNRILKAIEDRLLSMLIILLISPLLALIAIGVKLSSPGPVFYRQERVSWNGKPFIMLKFRSMPVDVETATGPVWATHGESRATRFGRFLRRTSLDELPQFINVLKGEMSIVGPRPERPVFVQKFKDEIPNYMKKHMVKAGVTGWAQVNGWRGDTDLCKRIEFDMQYIENWSLWFDLKIIFLTLFKGLMHRNAY